MWLLAFLIAQIQSPHFCAFFAAKVLGYRGHELHRMRRGPLPGFDRPVLMHIVCRGQVQCGHGADLRVHRHVRGREVLCGGRQRVHILRRVALLGSWSERVYLVLSRAVLRSDRICLHSVCRWPVLGSGRVRLHGVCRWPIFSCWSQRLHVLCRGPLPDLDDPVVVYGVLSWHLQRRDVPDFGVR